jgi:hypothetical protein
VSGAALIVHLDQVKGPSIQECLKTPCPLLTEDLFLLVIPLVLLAVVSLLVVKLWVLEVEHPQISVLLAQ